MRPELRTLTAAATLALVVCGLTACGGEPADAPRGVPNPSLPPSTEPARPEGAPPAATPPAPAPAPAPQNPPATPEEPPTPSDAQVPAAYLGQWQRTGTSCATRDETRLRVESQRVTFHESSGDVRSVEQDGDRLTLVLRMTGEGETRDATYRFGLSNDGRWLTDLDHDLVRERCP